VINCTLKGNSASGGYAEGGGVANSANNGLPVTGSTATGGSTLTVSNSTLSDNSATGDEYGLGGGIFNVGTVTVINQSAVSDNSARGALNRGGGIDNEDTGLARVSPSSIVSGNAPDDIFNYYIPVTQASDQPLDLVTPTSLTSDTTNGGVDFYYQVSGTPLAQDVRVAFYYASGPDLSDVSNLANPVYTTMITADGQTSGTYGPVNVPQSYLGSPPPGDPYLLIVTDPNNTLGFFNSFLNVQALAMPVVEVSPTSLCWDKQLGGVDFTYNVAADLSQPVPVAFYWSTGPKLSNAIAQVADNPAVLPGVDALKNVFAEDFLSADSQGNLIYTIPAGTAAGNQTFNVPGWFLNGAPTNATYLLAVVDPTNTLGFFDPVQSTVALSLQLQVSAYYQTAGGPWAMKDRTTGELPLLGNGGSDGTDTIYYFGCALTALAMELTYAGVPTDPGSLNQVLTNTNGYNDGDDLAPSAAVPLAVSAFQPGASVQWQDINTPYTAQALRDDLMNAAAPVMLKVNYVSKSDGSSHTHFLLVTGFDDNDDFTIVDPGHAVNSPTLLSQYLSTYTATASLTIYGDIQDPTDLSLLSVACGSENSACNLTVRDSNGDITGFDPLTGQLVDQIPGSFAYVDGPLENISGGPDDDTYADVVDIYSPGPGAYTMQTAVNNGQRFQLQVTNIAADGAVQSQQTESGENAAGLGSEFQVNLGGSGQLSEMKAATAVPISAVEGTPVTANVATVAGLGGADAASEYTATIDWGDGHASSGVLGGPDASGNFTVSGTNTYAEQGTYTATVTVAQEGVPVLTVSPIAIVSDAPPNVAVDQATVTSVYGITATDSGVFADYDDAVGIAASQGSVTQSGSTAGTWSWSEAGLSVGSYPVTITATNADGSVTSTSFTAAVTPAPLTITADDQTKVYGGALPLLSASYSGFVNGDTPASLTALPTLATTATANSPVSGNPYPITASGAVDPNYAISYLPGTLTVNPFAFSYTIGNDSQAYGVPASLAADLPATINTGVNGQTLDIAYASTGDTATALPGTYGITGTLTNGSGLLSNYNVTLVPGTLTVEGPGASAVGGTLFLVGGNTNDQVLIQPIGASYTGSSGIQVNASLDNINIHNADFGTNPAHPITRIIVSGFGGNDNLVFFPTLTIAAVIVEGTGNENILIGGGNNSITAGKGNDNIVVGNGANIVTLGDGNDNLLAGNGNNALTLGKGNDNVLVGNGNNTIVAGNGNDNVVACNGNNTISLGNGNDNVVAGDGNNVIVTGGGNDNIRAGNGDNLIVGGLGHVNIQVGNGKNILIDGSVQLTQNALGQVLGDWMSGDDTDVQSMLSGAIIYNTTNGNTLHAGTGLDWFWATYAKDKINNKPGDLLN
jgi:hypothetical protein